MSNKGTILIVDDNPMNLDMTKDILEHAGYDTIQAEDADTGLRPMEQNHPDLVLLDLYLPRKDGFETSRIIKSNPALKDIPLIAFTALASKENQEKAIEAGCDGVICKPIQVESFVSTIENYLHTSPTNGNTKAPELAKTEVPQTPQPAPTQQSKPHQILVVDDNLINLDLLRDILINMNQVPTCIQSGEEALRFSREKLPDLILLDVMMPGMDGYAVLNELKATPETADIPVIMISALNRTEDRVKGLLHGCSDYITKPFNFEEVQARVSVALRLKDLQDELKRQRDQLYRSNRDLEQFTSIASHDLQAPLRRIIIYSEKLLRSKESQYSEQDKDTISRIHRGATSMQHLIWDLLALSRASYRSRTVISLNLKSIMEESLQELHEAVQESHAQVYIDELGTIEGDKTQIRQLFTNLLSNAIKFRKPDTAPVIRIASDTLPDGFLNISIQDNGIGFPPEQSESIFQAFERLEADRYPGTGIGLAICGKVVERHGGTIRATSQPGEGSTFYIKLPVKQEA